MKILYEQFIQEYTPIMINLKYYWTKDGIVYSVFTDKDDKSYVILYKEDL